MKRPWEILLRIPKFAVILAKKPALAAKVLHHHAQAALSNKPLIRAIEYGVTYECQAKCDKCSAVSMKKTDLPLLSREQIRQMANDCTALGNYETNFTGGEPLLDRNLEDLIADFNPRKTFIGINTNGALLDGNRIHTLANAGADVLKISIDSPIPEEHDQSRGIDGLFNHILDVLRMVREVSMIRAHLCLVATKEMIESGKALKVLELAKANDATLGIVLPAATGGWSQKHEVLIEKQHRAALEKMALDTDVFLQGNIGKSGFFCPCGTREIYITCYGEIIPCPFIQISFGSIHDESFDTIYKRMVNWKQKSHNGPMCASAEDPAFRKKFVDPINAFETTPVRYTEHPEINDDD